MCYAFNTFEGKKGKGRMQTVRKKAWNPITNEEYEIELPVPEIVREAILELDYPTNGMRIISTAQLLSDKFQLSDKQKNAEKKSGERYLNIFRYDIVAPAFKYLLDRGKLKQPGGSKTPYFLVTQFVEPDSVIEKNYQKIKEELAVELLQKIKDNKPTFFEKLVVDLLVAMGYGGSREDAQAVGRSGDGGIDGVINEDRLGLDVIYVQAKRWENNVGEPPIRDFVGALQGKRARKGIFITTSEFSNRAQEYISAIDSRDSKVILIDGNQLAQLMIDHDVGVSVEKTYEIKRVDSDYFAENAENS